MRADAARRGDVNGMQVWAGQGAALARAEPAADVVRDPRAAVGDARVLRQQLANSLVDLECLKYHSWHILTQTSKGKDLGFEAESRIGNAVGLDTPASTVRLLAALRLWLQR